jgi:hypothetical protein
MVAFGRVIIRRMRFTSVLILTVLLIVNLHGQESRDFLRKNFGKLNTSGILDTLIRLSEKYAEENPDTALFFGKR